MRPTAATTPMQSRHLKAAIVLTAYLAVCLLGLLPASALAARSVTFTPSFAMPSDLGEPAVWRGELTLSGSEYFGQVAPLTELTIHLPEGTEVNAGPETCSRETIEQLGWWQCPAGSIAGPGGTLTAVVRFGAEAYSEEGTTETIFGPGGVVYVVLEGHSPVDLEIIGEAHYASATPPYGPAFTLSLPTIETVPGAPDTSITAMTLNLGTEDYNEVTVPSTCPSGHFAWAADAGFSHEPSEPVATAETACPAAGGRGATITSLHVSNAAPKRGEVVTLTATVEGAHVSSPVPTGSVEFLDNGAAIAGCTAQPLSASGSSATATCQVSYAEYGAHTIEADYGGDGNYKPSSSGTENVVLSTEAEPPHHEASSSTPSVTSSTSSTGTSATITPPAVISRAQLLASLGGQLILSGKATRLAALLRADGLTMPFSALEAGTLTVQWYAMPSGAKAAKHSKALLIASGKAQFAGAGSGKLKLQLTAQGKKLLKHSKKVAVTVKGAFVPTAGVVTSVVKSVVLR